MPLVQLNARVLGVIALPFAVVGVCESAEPIRTLKVPKGVHLFWCGHRLSGKVKATIANDTLFLNGKGPWLAAADTMNRWVGYMIGCGLGGSSEYRSQVGDECGEALGEELNRIVSGIHAGKPLDELRLGARSPGAVETVIAAPRSTPAHDVSAASR